MNLQFYGVIFNTLLQMNKSFKIFFFFLIYDFMKYDSYRITAVVILVALWPLSVTS